MDIEKYQDRKAAGLYLASQLQEYHHRQDAIVLALPRGGVPVAHEIANSLQIPLDVFIVRKLGVPHHKEFAMGAIAIGGKTFLEENTVKQLQISTDDIETVVATEYQELLRREKVYRGKRLPLDLKNKLIILVDDGIATGATMRVAITALREFQPVAIIVAAPVGERDTLKKIKKIADKVICPLIPENFYAVGAHYQYFDQTSDEEVINLLSK